VDKEKIITGDKVREGDVVIALGSNGVHSNGFSFIRKLVEKSGSKWSDPFPGMEGTFLDILFKPTRIYVRALLDLIRQVEVRAVANITGGGVIDNIPRTFPEGLAVQLTDDWRSGWDTAPIFDWLEGMAAVDEDALETGTSGIGPWETGSVYDWLRANAEAQVDPWETARTLNCGVGMTVIVSEENVDQAIAILKDQGEIPRKIGEIKKKTGDEGVLLP
jgi:phosphoribosylformylglycinamidine cyclo-ligase